jgi:FdhD protein
MPDTYIKRPIHRVFTAGKAEAFEDEIVKEHRLQIRLDGKDFVQAVLSPNLLEEFVLGFLRTRGLIGGLQDVVSIEIDGTTASVVRSPHLRRTIPELTLLESTGSRNIDRDSAFRPAAGISPSSLRVSPEVIADGLKALAEMPIYKRTGGTHCAILFSERGEILFSAEDIGRHNAVDKVVGGALNKGVDLSRSWLAVSGRLPADMVMKAVVVGIPLIASVSAPTSDGIDAGEHAGVTVVGFVRGGRLNCYSHPERIAREQGITV